MAPTVNGLHHVTAISGGAQRNLDFWAGALGLRLVKKTVNFDDPGTYHLYYGDELGTPGTVLTFFPWENIAPGRRGVGEAALTRFAVPPGSLPFWRERLQAVSGPETRFGEELLLGRDPDGLEFALVVPAAGDDRAPWATGEISEGVAIRGFHGVTLTVPEAGPTAALLELLGYELVGEEDGIERYASANAGRARFVDLDARPGRERALQGAGSVHHIAFAVADRAAQMAVRERLVAAGFQVKPQIDRNYFYSIYFRSPGGVLFEVATEEPGFTVDEPAAELGRHLKLPRQHEHLRAGLERRLPPLRLEG